LHDRLTLAHCEERAESAEHVFVGLTERALVQLVATFPEKTCLVVTRAEDKLRIGITVEDALHDLTLVDSDRADFKILLPNQNCSRLSNLPLASVALHTFNRTLGYQVVLEQVETLLALE
jgi:hypothetical protein